MFHFSASHHLPTQLFDQLRGHRWVTRVTLHQNRLAAMTEWYFWLQPPWNSLLGLEDRNQDQKSNIGLHLVGSWIHCDSYRSKAQGHCSFAETNQLLKLVLAKALSQHKSIYGIQELQAAIRIIVEVWIYLGIVCLQVLYFSVHKGNCRFKAGFCGRLGTLMLPIVCVPLFFSIIHYFRFQRTLSVRRGSCHFTRHRWCIPYVFS